MQFYDPYTDSFIQEGWVCPRCKKVLAPWVSYCDCVNNIRTTNYTIVNDSFVSTKTIHDGNTHYDRTILQEEIK